MQTHQASSSDDDDESDSSSRARRRRKKPRSPSPKKKTHGGGARPKKRVASEKLREREKRQKDEMLARRNIRQTEENRDGDPENISPAKDQGRSGQRQTQRSKTFLVSVNTPMHLCPYRQRNGCRYGVCHDCFMREQADGGKRRKRKRNKERKCCHDELEGLKADGEANNYTAAYFEGPKEGGDLPTNCGLCGISVVKGRED